LLFSQKKQLEHTPAAPIPRERSTEKPWQSYESSP